MSLADHKGGPSPDKTELRLMLSERDSGILVVRAIQSGTLLDGETESDEHENVF